ncbi:MAG: hypothetical protein DRP61_01125 [Candidatus Omnitrophota bacterium]|nr:MAG: hypothetical protein DRP61_01125 [Candidatus Omnitrophota bacterium]RKY44034.1 MAG: hypothetical protein DRP80_03525 [Candidatus Omnitrophota bacterium]
MRKLLIIFIILFILPSFSYPKEELEIPSEVEALIVWGAILKEEVAKPLGLSSEQKDEIAQIISYYSQKLDSLRKASKKEISKIKSRYESGSQIYLEKYKSARKKAYTQEKYLQSEKIRKTCEVLTPAQFEKLKEIAQELF